MPERLDQASDAIDQSRSALHGLVSGDQHGSISLRLGAPMPDRVQELGISCRQARQVLCVDPVGLAVVLVDQPQLTSVGDHDFVARLRQEAADPGRVAAHLDRDPCGWLPGEPATEGRRSTGDTALLQHLAAGQVEHEEMAVAVAKVDPDAGRMGHARLRHGWLLLGLEPGSCLQHP